MTASLLLSAVLALAQGPGVTAHVDEARASAERLQGPLDGRWRLIARGPNGPRVDLVLADPPDGTALQGAWTGPGAASPRSIARLSRRGERLVIALDPEDGPPIIARLVRMRRGWRGVLRQGRAVWAARLVRGPAAR